MSGTPRTGAVLVTAARAPVRVRSEALADADAVRDVVTRAFERADEARLVDALRAAGQATVALVAECGGDVVGHVLFSPVTLDGAPFGLGLAPLAVTPQAQSRGVGAALVRAGLGACRARGVETIVVLGAPAYYGRFGLVAAARHGLHSEYEAPPGAFQVLALSPGALAGRCGLVRYCDAFACV